MSTIRLRGLAERAFDRLPLTGAGQPLGPDVIVPETVPVRIEFDTRETVGTAALRRDEQGIWADVTIYPDASARYAPAFRDGTYLELCPKFAVGVMHAVISKDDTRPAGVITSGEIVSVSLCRENVDADLPPYEVLSDAAA